MASCAQGPAMAGIKHLPPYILRKILRRVSKRAGWTSHLLACKAWWDTGRHNLSVPGIDANKLHRAEHLFEDDAEALADDAAGQNAEDDPAGAPAEVIRRQRVTLDLDETVLLNELRKSPSVRSLSLGPVAVKKLTGNFLKALAEELPGLRCLEVDNVPWKEVADVDIGKLSGLTRLILKEKARWSRRSVMDEDFLDFRGRMKNLPTTLRSAAAWVGLCENLRVLVIHCEDFVVPPDLGWKLPRLEVLELDCAHMEGLPQSLENLSRLKTAKLVVAAKHFDGFNFAGWRSLEALTLQCTSLASLPGSFGGLGCLRTLRLISCHSLTSLPESMGDLGSLEVIEATECGLTHPLPDSIGRCTRLRSVRLLECPVTELPEGIGGCASLEALVVTGGEVGILPDTIGLLRQLKSMEVINVYDDPVCVPDALGQCSSLESLTIRCSFLPETVEHLKGLTHLDASGLQWVPEELGNATGLRVLKLDHLSFDVTALNNSLGNLSHLKEFHLTGALVRSLPTTLGRLTELELLYLKDCPELKKLPVSMGKLCKLRSLSVHDCFKFAEVPTTINGCISLEAVTFEKCPKLAELPLALGSLPCLASLKVASCSSIQALHLVPDAMRSLRSLVLLHCNQLRQVFSSNPPVELALPPAARGRKRGAQGQVLTVDRLPSGPGMALLEEVCIEDCPLLKVLPGAICQSPSLRSLTLVKAASEGWHCTKLPPLESLTLDCRTIRFLEQEGVQETLLQRIKSFELRCHHHGTWLDLEIDMDEADRYSEKHEGKKVTCPVTLPAALTRFTTLESLRFPAETLYVPEALALLPNLKQWDLFCLKQCMKRVAHRQRLWLGSLPPTFAPFCRLQSLKIEFFPGEAIAVSLQGLSSLRVLQVHQCPNLTALPASLGTLASLEQLEVYACPQIRALPEEIVSLRGLSKLGISSCPAFRGLSDAVAGLSNLQHLRLSFLKLLTHLPARLGFLPSLETLEVVACPQLRSLPSSLGAPADTRLKACTLKYLPSLGELPPSLTSIQGLVLKASNCAFLSSGAGSAAWSSNGNAPPRWIQRGNIREEMNPSREDMTDDPPAYDPIEQHLSMVARFCPSYGYDGGFR